MLHNFSIMFLSSAQNVTHYAFENCQLFCQHHFSNKPLVTANNGGWFIILLLR